MIKTRAELFEAAAKMMRMCDEAGIEYSHKYGGMNCVGIDFENGDINKFEFPLAIVEGKPVFVGDELYQIYGSKYRFQIGDTCNPNCYSWNPPKPKTVMVELLREDAEKLASCGISIDGVQICAACRKALEKE